jgi:hypothetical protein
MDEKQNFELDSKTVKRYVIMLIFLKFKSQQEGDR